MKKLILPVTIIVLLGLLVAWQPWQSLAAPMLQTQPAQENPPDTQSAVAETASLGEGTKVTASLLDQPPVLSAEEQQKMETMTIAANPPMPAIPVGDTAVQRDDSVPSADSATQPMNALESNPQTGIDAPGTMVTFRQTYSSPSSLGGNSGVVGSPTAANNGYVVFKTGNWYAAVSSNGGQTFKYVNPWTTFPNSYGGFCCDQKVVYDPSRDMFIWSLMYLPNATTGDFRIAISHGADATRGDWTYWDFEAGSTFWWSYPDLTLSNDFVYVTANRYTISGGAFNSTWIFRLPLDALSDGTGFGYDYISDSTHFGFRAVNGANETIYWAAQNTTSQVMLYWLAENSGTFYWTPIDLSAPWYNTTPTCLGPGSKNMCGRVDNRILTGWVSRGIIAFLWTSSQGGSFPYPYIEGVAINEAAKTYNSRPYLYYGGGAYIYPAATVNARGDIGLVANYNQSNVNPSVVYGVRDDFNNHVWETWYAGISSTQGPDNNIWGDYNSVTAFAPTGLVWGGSGHILSGCGANNGCAYPTYFIFGRSRDMRSLTRYWEPRFGIFAPIVTK